MHLAVLYLVRLVRLSLAYGEDCEGLITVTLKSVAPQYLH